MKLPLFLAVAVLLAGCSPSPMTKTIESEKWVMSFYDSEFITPYGKPDEKRYDYLSELLDDYEKMKKESDKKNSDGDLILFHNHFYVVDIKKVKFKQIVHPEVLIEEN